MGPRSLRCRGAERALVAAATYAITSIGIAGCPGSDPAPQVAWREAFPSEAFGTMSGVWGSGPNDVFIVGGRPEQGEVHHFDGNQWAPMTVPNVPLLVWAYGFGPDDVFAVGLDGAVVHYNGDAWQTVESGVTEDLWGIFGFSRDELWIVGGEPMAGEPVILHFDGAGTFRRMPVDAAENRRGAHALFKVWGIDGRLFAVGQLGLILEYDGDRWVYAPAGAEADQDFVSLWGTAGDHIVAVGGRSNARIAVFDGSAWRTSSPPQIGGLNAVYMAEPDEAIVGGVFGYVGAFAPSSGALQDESQDVTRLDVHAIWGDGAGRHYAVGGFFLEPFDGFALIREVVE